MLHCRIFRLNATKNANHALWKQAAPSHPLEREKTAGHKNKKIYHPLRSLSAYFEECLFSLHVHNNE